MRSATDIRPGTRAEFERALVDLIAHGLTSKRRRSGPVVVDTHTPLFESGLVDSLAILELIAFVEAAIGRRIPARQVHIKHFGTIEHISATFWQQDNEACDDTHQQLVS